MKKVTNLHEATNYPFLYNILSHYLVYHETSFEINHFLPLQSLLYSFLKPAEFYDNAHKKIHKYFLLNFYYVKLH